MLKILKPREKKAFLNYMRSVGSHVPEPVVQLTESLLGPRSAEQGSALPKKALFPDVFGPETDFADNRFRKAMEQLLRQVERFLVTEQVAADPFEFRLRLLALLAERRPTKLLRRLIDAPLPFPALESDWTIEHFEQAARWYQMVYDYRSNTTREHDPGLHRRATRCQTIALLTRRLRSACIFRSNQKDPAAWPPDPLLDWAIEAIPQSDFGELPLVRTLLAAYTTLENPDATDSFERFQTDLLSGPACLTRADRRDLLLVAINFCSKRYNTGDTARLDTQLKLYEYGLQNDLLLENGWITGYTFINIGTLALIGRRYRWLEQFISGYREKVEPRYRESSAAFNQARLDYALKRYRPALALLQQDLFDDVLLNLSAKTVQAKCFHELNETDLLDTHLDAMRKYIRRHKEVGYYGERYLNFTAVLRRIVRAKPGDRTRLQEEIQNLPVLAERDWLLEWV